ncbi:MAG: chain length-determining protein [Rubrivivax sp.]|nr:chain length-determining protein [Rubrivivax sp.]
MSNIKEQLGLLTDALWRHRKLALLTGWTVGLLGAAAVWYVPERQEASAKLYVDTQSVLKPLMSGLAFQPDQEQQVRMLAKTLISRPNVETLVNEKALGFDTSNPAQTEILIEQLTQKIQMRPLGGGNLYSLSYRDVDGARALALIDRLVSMFVTTGTESKRRDSKDASKFIDAQIKTYEAKLTEAEDRLKEYKLRNFGVSGTGTQDHFARISALSEATSKLQIDLSAAINSRDALLRELKKEDPQLPREALGPAGQAQQSPPSEVDTRLEFQRRQLDELQRRFTDLHPDVIAAKRLVRELEASQAQERARASAERGPSGNAATNPVYQSLRVSLAKAESDVATLRTQLGAQQALLAKARDTASKVPQAEAELAQLNRDYEIIRKNYDQLVARRESAALGVKLDESTASTEFRIVEPPNVSPSPVFPSRKFLALLVIVLSVVSGVVAAYAMSVARPVIGRVSELKALTGRPVLGSISVALTDAGRAVQRRERVQLVTASGLLLVALFANLVMTALARSS